MIKETSACQREMLASGSVASVERCGCGTLHLTLGAMTLRIQEEALFSLCSTVAEALSALARRQRREMEDGPGGMFHASPPRGLS